MKPPWGAIVVLVVGGLCFGQPPTLVEDTADGGVSGTVFLQAARNAAKAGDIETAIERFEAYLTRHPLDGDVSLELIGLIDRQGQRERALRVAAETIEVWRARQEVEPDDEVALRYLARLTRWMKWYDESLEWYERYLRIRPDDQEARLEQARLAGWNRQPEKAQEYYQGMVEDFPDAPVVRAEMLAKYTNWLGRNGQAAGHYEEALKFSPDDSELRFDLGQVYSRLNYSRRAAEQYDHILSLYPDHAMAARARSAEQWRQHPHVEIETGVRYQAGRDDNIQITHQQTNLLFAPRRIAEGLDLAAGVGHSSFWFNLPSTSPIDEYSQAEHATLKFDKTIDAYSRLWGDAQVTHYEQGSRQSLQLTLGASKTTDSGAKLSFIAGLEDVLENASTLDDGLSRFYIQGEFDVNLSPRVGLAGYGRGLWYDDENRAVEYNARLHYTLSAYPRLLQLRLAGYGFFVADEQAAYWTPDRYNNIQAGFSWYHFLNHEHFESSERLYYYVECFVGTDDDKEPFFNGRVGMTWDSRKQWKVTLEASVSQSDVFESRHGTVRVTYAW